MARALPRKKATPVSRSGARGKSSPAVSRAASRRPRAARVTVPEATIPKPKPSVSTIAVAARGALQSQLARLWAAASKVSTESVDGVTMHVALLQLPQPHWHLMTDGLSAIGFELSLRLPASKEDVGTPAWGPELMRHLIASARAGQLAATLGQSVTLARPIGAADSSMQAVTFGADPVVKALATPGGDISVRVVFGLMRDEARLTREWSPAGLLDVASRVNPMLLTDVDRASLLMSPRARVMIEQRVEREGSAMESFATRVSELSTSNKQTTWKLDTDAVETVVSLLKGRIGHQRPFTVKTGRMTVEVTPVDGAASGTTSHVLKLTQTAARQMRATLKAKPGTYRWDALPDFAVEIVN